MCKVDKINLNLNCLFKKLQLIILNWFCRQEQLSIPTQIFLAFIKFMRFINKTEILITKHDIKNQNYYSKLIWILPLYITTLGKKLTIILLLLGGVQS